MNVFFDAFPRHGAIFKVFFENFTYFKKFHVFFCNFNYIFANT